jgi:hypothetical protein
MRIQWQTDCVFIHTTASFTFKHTEGISIDVCGHACLNHSPACSFFYHTNDNCYLMLGFILMEPSTGHFSPLFDELNSAINSDSKPSCGYVIPLRLWRQSTEDKRVLLLPTCTYVPFIIHGPNWNGGLSSISTCQTACLEDYQCSAFGYNEDDDFKCIVPDADNRWNHQKKYLNFQYTHPESSSQCGVVTSRIWQEAVTTRYKINYNKETFPLNETYFWQNNCMFISKVIDIELIFNISIDQCVSICANDSSYCNHFNYILHYDYDIPESTCHLMLAPDVVERVYYADEVDDGGQLRTRFACGFLANRVGRWEQLGDDERVMVQYECDLLGSSDNGTDVSFADSFSSCQTACLDDYRCNAFSYVEELCGLPFRNLAISQDLSVMLNIHSLLRHRSPFFRNGSISIDSSRLHSSVCGVITTRNWNFGLLLHDSNNNSLGYVSQINCKFNHQHINYNIEQFPPKFNASFMDCISYCFSSIRCTHFTYLQHGVCYMMIMNTSTLMDRVMNEESSCGYIPSRLEASGDGIQTIDASNVPSNVNILTFIVLSVVIFFFM